MKKERERARCGVYSAELGMCLRWAHDPAQRHIFATVTPTVEEPGVDLQVLAVEVAA